MDIGCAIYLEFLPAIEEIYRSFDAQGISTIYKQKGQQLHLSLINGAGGNKRIFIDSISRIDINVQKIQLLEIKEFEVEHRVSYFSVSSETQQKLKTLQNRVYDSAVDAGIEVFPYYHPNIWRPHVTIAGGYSESHKERITRIAELFEGIDIDAISCGVASYNQEKVVIEREWPVN